MPSFRDYLTAYCANADDTEALYYILTMGMGEFPKYAQSVCAASKAPFGLDANFVQSMIWKRDIAVILYFDSILFNLFQQYRCDDAGELKRQIISFNATLLKFKRTIPDQDFQSLVTVYSKELIEIVPDCGIETSVITGCAPIVPYVGTLKKPFIGERDLTDEELQDMLRPVTEGLITVNSPDDTKRDVLKHMVDIIYHNPSLVIFMMRNSGIFETQVDAAHLVDMIHGVCVDTVDRMTKLLYAYYLYSAIYQYADQYISMESNMRSIVSDIKAFLSMDLESYVSMVGDALPANEELLMYELENGANADEYMKYPEKNDKSGDIDPLRLFNFDELMNYIYVNRRFRANHYTNSAFMNMSVIGGYIFYKGFLIIKPKTSDDQELNYLYIPVIDDLNGSQVRIIKFYRDNKIEILTENEYAKDINEN